MKNLSILFLSLVFAACNNAGTDNKSNVDTISNSLNSKSYDSENIIGSYAYEHNGDTIAMHLNLQGDSVMGQLIYALKEKDINSGNFKGVIVDSVLIATYEFESEGQLSKREVAFKLDGKSAVEGYGEVIQEGYGFKFKNRDKLKFGDGVVLVRLAD